MAGSWNGDVSFFVASLSQYLFESRILVIVGFALSAWGTGSFINVLLWPEGEVISFRRRLNSTVNPKKSMTLEACLTISIPRPLRMKGRYHASRKRRGEIARLPTALAQDSQAEQ